MKPVIGLVVPLPLGKPELPAFSHWRIAKEEDLRGKVPAAWTGWFTP